MKVFQIGFNKCATTSLNHMFRQSGMSTVHWDSGKLAKKIRANSIEGKMLLDGIDNYEFYSDLEHVDSKQYIYAFSDHFKELDEQYPGSKFILNTRSIGKWLKSRERHGNGSYLNRFISILDTDRDGVIKYWEKLWYKHHAEVTSYFDGKENLLLFDIDNDNPEKIVNFMRPHVLDGKHYLHTHKTKYS